MEYGIRGHDLGCHEPDRLAAVYTENGVECVQLAIPKAVPGLGSYLDIDDALLAQLKQALGGAGIGLPVLGCYVEPSLADEAERQKQLEIFRVGIRCAAALGTGCIGTETTDYTGSKAGREQALARLYTSVETMLRDAEPYNVTVAIEPVAAHTLHTPEQAWRLLQRFKGANLAIIWDPVNLLTQERAQDQAALWRECIDAFDPAVAAMHIKDTFFQNGEKRPCRLGQGIMEYEAIAAWLKAQKPAMALLREETSPTAVQTELQWMRENL